MMTRRAGVVLAIALILLALLTAIGLSQARRANDNALRVGLSGVRKTQYRQHLQIVENCERLNVQRATANNAYDGAYHVFRVVLISIGPPSTARDRRFDSVFVPQLRSAVNRIAWTPLTDCIRAIIASGPTYKTPQSVRFVVSRPPSSALDVKNAARPRPLGSVG